MFSGGEWYPSEMRIHLHDSLAALHSGPIDVQASSVAEAVSALRLYPGFNPKSGKRYQVSIDGFGSRDAIYDHTNVKEIHLRPVMAGSGRPGMMQIVLGVIMIAVSFFAPYLSPAMASSLMVGGAMSILGGVLQMLAPQPSVNTTVEEKSRYLSGGQNTVAIGTPIPLIYGRRKVYGQYLSFDLEAGEMNKAPASWYASPFTVVNPSGNSASPPQLPNNIPGQFDTRPRANFNGINYDEGGMTTAIGYLNFSPALTLSVGNWDANFTTGQSLHVSVVGGNVSNAQILTGDLTDLPPVGTPIIFTRNYA